MLEKTENEWSGYQPLTAGDVGDVLLEPFDAMSALNAREDSTVGAAPLASVAPVNAAILLLGSDHVYQQVYGTNGCDGIAALCKSNGITMYDTMNTGEGMPYSPNSPGHMTWAQIKQLTDANLLDPLSHGVTHPASWERINTGVSVVYLGSGIACSGMVNYTLVNAIAISTSFQVTSSNPDDNATFLFSDYPVLAELAAAVNATGKYRMTLDPALPGAAPSSNLMALICPTPIDNADQTIGVFACGGGILLSYTGATYARMSVARGAGSSTIHLYADGIALGPGPGWSLLDPRFDTLAKIVVALNGLGVSGLSVKLCDNAGISNRGALNYVSGNEASINLSFCANKDIVLVPVCWDAITTPRSTMIGRQFAGSYAAALANGVTLGGFACSGREFFPWTLPAYAALPTWHFRSTPRDRVHSPAATIVYESAQPNVRDSLPIAGARIAPFYCGLGTAASVECTPDRRLIGLVNGSAAHPDSFHFDLSSAACDTIAGLKAAIENVGGGGKWGFNAIGLSTAPYPHHDPSTVLAISPPRNARQKGGGGALGAHIPADAITVARANAALDALATSPGFYSDILVPKILYDGSSGLAGLDDSATPSAGQGDMSEFAFNQMLTHAKGLINSQKIVPMRVADFHRVRATCYAAPSNLLFNPCFQYSAEDNLRVDETAASMTNGAGKRIPGWVLSGGAANIAAITVKDNAFTITTSSDNAILPLYQIVTLQQGVKYAFGADIEFAPGASPFGYARLFLQPVRGKFPCNSPREINPKIMTEPAFTTQGMQRHFELFMPSVTPVPTLIGARVEPFNLSANKNIRLNLDGIGATDDIDCTACAAYANAVTAKEVANAINAAIAAIPIYPAEFHTAASAINGKVVIKSPYRRGVDYICGVTLSAGKTQDAAALIFGASAGVAVNPDTLSTGSIDYSFFFIFQLSCQGTFKLSNPYLRQLRSKS
jgi:hypothetical protein